MKNRVYEMNMCEGPILSKVVLFAIPLMLSSILQLLFNAVDMIVVGRYVGGSALAAIGSTASLINLIINVFIGLSVGCNVVIANFYGANKHKDVKESVHTAICLGIVGGIFLSIVGIIFAKPMLTLMGTPKDVINESIKYMRIYFVGMPVIMVYNFGSSVLRAVGDTKRSLYFLSLAGVLNVILNLIFVLVFNMDVAGVAWATIISQCVSTFLIIITLANAEGSFRLDLKKLEINPDKLKQIVKIGLPAGLQGAIFSLSNVIIQSSINSFGSVAMAGNTAASNIENFVYASMNAFHHTVISFTAQNYGAKKMDRVRKSQISCMFITIGVGLFFGIGVYLLGEQLLSVYTNDIQAITYGVKRMSVVCTMYFLCGMQEIKVGYSRGLGKSLAPMIISIVMVCGVRIIWIFSVFRLYRIPEVLYLVYPVSWILAFIALQINSVIINKKLGINIKSENIPLL